MAMLAAALQRNKVLVAAGAVISILFLLGIAGHERIP